MSFALAKKERRKFSPLRMLPLFYSVPWFTLLFSVFNHYNRVRANLEATEPQDHVHEWAEVSTEDGASMWSKQCQGC
jgi:hypothetical protein